MGVFPSGQRGQTVNLLSLTSVVRIHPLPPKKSTCENKSIFFIHCESNGISSTIALLSLYLISPSGLHIITRQRVLKTCFRNDDIQNFRFDDIPQQVADDIHGFAVIFYQKRVYHQNLR